MSSSLSKNWVLLEAHPIAASEAISVTIATIGVFMAKFPNLTILNSILHILHIRNFISQIVLP
jgi:hypothetical protein